MRGPNLTNDERHRICCYLFENFSKGKLVRGSMNILAEKYQVHRRTIYEIWKLGKRQREAGDMFQLDSKIKGGKSRPTIELPVERILATSLGDRGSMKTFDAAIGVSALTEEYVFNILYFALTKLSYNRISCSLKFKDMANIIHIDEKWFYNTEDQAKFFLLMEEDTPYRACKSKSFITKVMFMAAVSRPIYDGNGNLLFDGKIGIFPFTFQAPAQRRSINRPAGILETKSIPSINKQVTKEMILNKIIPAIQSKWPASMSKNIMIQQDNARPHIKNDDPDFRMAATSNGFNITLTQQPANSPDLNVLDLGFFRSIQSLQERKKAKTVDKLVSTTTDMGDNNG